MSDYQPPQPAPGHEWNPNTNQWQSGRKNMKSYRFFNENTGLLHPMLVKATDANDAALQRPPAGHKLIEGDLDHLSQRVDLSSGHVVDWQPPQPTPDHEWHTETKRWVLSDTAHQRLEARATALARISQLEGEVQPGLLRAVALGQAGAKEKLAALDAEVSRLRATAQEDK